MGTLDAQERVGIDCRGSESGCTVTITGSRDEVLELALFHVVNRHQHEDTPQLREQLKADLVSEASIMGRVPPASKAAQTQPQRM